MTIEERALVKNYLYSNRGNAKLLSETDAIYSAEVGNIKFAFAFISGKRPYDEREWDRLVPESFEGNVISAIVIDYESHNNEFYGHMVRILRLPSSIEVIVAKRCPDNIVIWLLDDDTRPVLKYPYEPLRQINDNANIVFCDSRCDPNFTGCTTVSKIILKVQYDRFAIPDNIVLVEDYAVQGIVDELDIQGRLTEFTLRSFTDLRVSKTVRINRPLHEICHLLEQFRYGGGYREPDPHLILKAPELDSTPSINPGFIRATSCDEDNIMEINVLNILYYIPISVERYDGEIRGTRFYFTSGNLEYNRLYLDVYESPKLIAEKIQESMNRISNNIGSISVLVDKLAESIKIHSKE